MSVELKPCPFCGRGRGGLFIETDEIGWHFVVCAPSDGGCGASGPGGVDDDHAEELWNRRARATKGGHAMMGYTTREDLLKTRTQLDDVLNALDGVGPEIPDKTVILVIVRAAWQILDVVIRRMWDL